MARNPNTPVLTPGAAGATTPPPLNESQTGTGDAGGDAGDLQQDDDAAAAALAAKDAEIVQLKAQLSGIKAAQAAAAESAVLELETPHNREHRLNSKHYHMTTAEVMAQAKQDGGAIFGGELKVYCKDGWAVNTGWRPANG